MTHKIAFPKLGLNFNVNRVAFTLFGTNIFWYAIIIITGFILGASFVAQRAKKKGINTDHIWNIAIFGLVFGVIGARIYYCIFDYDTIKDDFWNILRIWEGGLAIYGGIIAAVITAFVYCKIKKLEVLEIFDLCCQGLLIGQAVGRWGNFVNGEVFGQATDLPWGMLVQGGGVYTLNPVHPLFLYESLWNIVGLLLIIAFGKKVKAKGTIFFFYIFWYSFGRFFLEGMRDTDYILKATENFGISQIVGIIGIICGAAGIIILQIKRKYVEEKNNSK